MVNQNFLLGQNYLRAYAAGGNVRFLEDAEGTLEAVPRSDRFFERAQFYLAIAKTQLRKSEEAITIFDRLKDANLKEIGIRDNDFRNQVELQLAFAQIKTYTDHGYAAAEAILCRLADSSDRSRDVKLQVQAKSLQAFLYAVMAGRSSAKSERPHYAIQALNLATTLLNSPAIATEARFEALNASGITWMRIAEGASFGNQEEWLREKWQQINFESSAWQNAERSYRDALAIIPNSVRTLQNFATMRLIQARLAREEKRADFRKEAKEAVLRSLEVNDQDQFPYSQLAEIAIEEGDLDLALKYIEVGKTRHGAVKPEKWQALQNNIFQKKNR